MKKAVNPTWEHLKLALFVFCLVELVLFFMAIIFAGLLGYDLALIVSFWLGVIIALCAALIVLLNMFMIVLYKIGKTIIKR